MDLSADFERALDERDLSGILQATQNFWKKKNNVNHRLINHGLLIRGGTLPIAISSSTFFHRIPPTKQPFGVY